MKSRPTTFALALSLVLLLCADLVRSSYYLPGVSPRSYQQYEAARLFVTKLTSTKTQMPYDYYALPYCKPSKPGLQSENLGEVLAGDRIENSVYKLEVKAPKSCEVACAVRLGKTEKDAFVRAIDDDYRVHWIVDNLPVGMEERNEFGETTFRRGFPVGFHTGNKVKTYKHYINNHIRIIIKYHDDLGQENVNGEDVLTKIVGFRVEPISIKHAYEGEYVPGTTVLSTCNPNTPAVNDPKLFQNVDRAETVIFTYDVFWEKSDVEWGNRWDVYLNVSAPNDKVHWFSITNSIMIVLFLTVMIAMILVRALRKDIAQYNDPASLEEAKEESGWKLVHGDVFRAPANAPMLFSVFVGTGIQLSLMSLATLTFAILGLLSPANRGSLVTGFILLFVFMGSAAGYYSSTTYKMFRGAQWKQNTLLTAFFYPGAIFTLLGGLNLVLWMEGSSGALPFATFFTLLFLWFCVSVPLVFLGSFFGYKRESIKFPVRTNQIPRAIPVQVWYMHPIITSLVGGILPFGAVSVELYFIMSALWLHQIYYAIGFVLLVGVVLFATCAEISILLCYLQLCNEDYRWWWRSFLSSGSCAGYTLLYAVWYNLTELSLSGFVPLILYFVYMGIISFTFFLITGTIGYHACLWFNIQIYNSIKVD